MHGMRLCLLRRLGVFLCPVHTEHSSCLALSMLQLFCRNVQPVVCSRLQLAAATDLESQTGSRQLDLKAWDS